MVGGRRKHRLVLSLVTAARCRGLSTRSALTGLFPVTEAAVSRNADPEAVFVVTGASRGLGAEYCAQLLARTRGHVIGCCRDALLLDERLRGSERFRAVELDVSSDASIERLASEVGDRVDVLINNVGVLHEAGHMPERALADVDPAWLRRSLDVNCVGALLTTQALAPALRPTGDRPDSVVVNMSARVGSISDNRMGGWYSYRISKAALNMATKTLALELKRSRVCVVALHPGTANTGLSEPFHSNVQPDKLFDPAFAVGQLLAIVDGLQRRHAGGFFAWDGQPIAF